MKNELSDLELDAKMTALLHREELLATMKSAHASTPESEEVNLELKNVENSCKREAEALLRRAHLIVKELKNENPELRNRLFSVSAMREDCEPEKRAEAE